MLITGGGDGIGGGMVRSFSEAGATVFYCDIKEHGDPPPTATFIRCDVQDRAAIAETVSTVATASGGVIDVLCNNVGVVLEAGTPLHETSDDAWDTTLAINLTSYFKFSQACIPLMLAAGGGCIIQTASVQGLQSMPGVCSYAASKGAISSLTRQMAVEYASKGIRINSICPGTIATPMAITFAEDNGGSIESDAKRDIPMQVRTHAQPTTRTVDAACRMLHVSVPPAMKRLWCKTCILSMSIM